MLKISRKALTRQDLYDYNMDMKKSFRSIFYILLALSGAVLLCGCQNRTNAPYSKSGLYFDTIVSVDIFAPSGDPEEILDKCMEMCAHYQALFDKNISTSDIARINSGHPRVVDVDHDTALLISDALKYSDLSGGKFDITVAPVSELWDFHEGRERIPDKDEIAKALTRVDHNNIKVDTVNDTVTVLADGLSLDVGAAAKGYIADRISGYLSACGVSGAIINMGGDMKLTGHKPDGNMFTIGINDPERPGSCVASSYLTDMAIATSGTYERAFTAGGTRYHHILDVKSGYPADTDLLSVTVITKDALDADCLCTVCILLGSDKALQLVENTPDTEAYFILDDGSVLKSSGADRYIRQ